MSCDAVVVGGGISGLTSALILARQGRQVTLVEKSPRIAPLIRGFSREGVEFDSAFHYAGGLADGEVLDLLFRYLGLSDRLQKVPFNAEGFDLFRDVDDGREFRFPTGIKRLEAALCGVFPGENVAIRNYLAKLETVCRTLPFLDPETPAEHWDASGVVQGPSLAEVLNGLTDNLALKNLLSLHTLLHGVPAEEVSFAIHASVVALYYRSAFSLVGGGRALAEAFEQELEAAGVTLVLGRTVKTLTLTSAGALQGVELADGERIDCRECLVSTHPDHFLAMAPEGTLRPAFRKRLRNLEDTASAFILYGAGPNHAPILDGTNLILGRLAEAGDSWSGEFGKRPLFMAGGPVGQKRTTSRGWVAICPARWPETAAWSDSTAHNRPAGYRVEKERIVNVLLERVRRQAPEIAEQARILDAATPLTLRDFGGSPVGGLYGVKHKIDQYNPQPPTRIPGVFLTGQAVAAPGVLGAMISAFLTCGHLFGPDILRKEVLACR